MKLNNIINKLLRRHETIAAVDNRGKDLPSGKLIVAIDFDGVLHSYDSGWHGPTVITDKVNKGAINFLRKLVNAGKYDIQVFSSRNMLPGGVEAMIKFLRNNNLGRKYVEQLSFPSKKPAYHILIDDRAMLFNGVFPTIEEIDNFKPWNK